MPRRREVLIGVFLFASIVLLLFELGSAQLVHYGDQTTAGTIASSSAESGGESWLITVRSTKATREFIDDLYTRVVAPVASTTGFCSMDVYYSSTRARIALVCPADGTIKGLLVSALVRNFGTSAVTISENMEVALHGMYRQSLPGGVRSDSITVTNVPWNLDRIDTRTRIYNNEYVYDDDGSGSDVWVIDSGVRVTHTEFGGRAHWRGNTYDSVNEDCAGHGTHVAGIACGTNYGVAKGCQIHAIKVLNCRGEGTIFSVLNALDLVITLRSPTRSTIVNLSLNADRNTDLDEMVTELVNEHGIAVVVAAGNERSPAGFYSPSGAPVVLTVGATTMTDSIAPFSNYGSIVDIAAPGVNIISAWSLNDDSSTAVLDGTSMAAPHVSGALAIRWSQVSDKRASLVAMNLLVQESTRNVVTGQPIGNNQQLVFARLLEPPPVSPPVQPPWTMPSPKPVPPSLSKAPAQPFRQPYDHYYNSHLTSQAVTREDSRSIALVFYLPLFIVFGFF